MRRTFAAYLARSPTPWLILVAVLLSIPTIYGITRPAMVPPPRLVQGSQIYAVEDALDAFSREFRVLPPSEAHDVAGSPYCGAMKLVEAVTGRDMRGCHIRSAFRADGLDPDGVTLYPADPDEGNLDARRGPYLPHSERKIFRLADIYGKGKTGPLAEDALVLCDAFRRKRPSGEKTGMPLLYYRANLSGTAHDPNGSNPIYDYRDNAALVALGVPGKPEAQHPLAEPKRFYLNTQDVNSPAPVPVRRDSYILISAGPDGLYGTADDICNFEWRYRESGAQE
jgi:hypothetical protein